MNRQNQVTIDSLEELTSVSEFLQEGKTFADTGRYIADLFGEKIEIGEFWWQDSGGLSRSVGITPDVVINFPFGHKTLKATDVQDELIRLAAEKGLAYRFSSYNDTEGLPTTYYTLVKGDD